MYIYRGVLSTYVRTSFIIHIRYIHNELYCKFSVDKYVVFILKTHASTYVHSYVCTYALMYTMFIYAEEKELARVQNI